MSRIFKILFNIKFIILKYFFASDFAVKNKFSSLLSSSTIFMPLPPPPPAAFIKTGYPISLHIDLASEEILHPPRILL